MTIKSPTLRLSCSHSKVSSLSPVDVDVLLTIAAPDAPLAVARPSLNLALVIDASGSMAGAPIAHAKAAALQMVDRLSPTDRVALVVYAGNARLVCPSQELTASHRIRLLQEINAITAQGGTALHSGWLHGAQAVAPYVGPSRITRVLLLSDGDANVGVSDASRLRQEAMELLEAGISTSTYGLGTSFNETLMTAMAQGGRAFYAQNASALQEYFDMEFQTLSRIAGQNVSCNLTARSAEKIWSPEILNDVGLSRDRAQLPTLISGADVWAVYRIPNVLSASDLTIECDVTWTDLSGVTHTRQEAVIIQSSAKAKKRKDEVLSERVNELTAAKMHKKALEEARKGHWANADAILLQTHGLSANNAYLRGVSAQLSALASTRDVNVLSKETAYASFAMNTRAVLDNDDSSTTDTLGFKKLRQGDTTKDQAPPAEGAP